MDNFLPEKIRGSIEILGLPMNAHQLSVTDVSSNQVLSQNIFRISIYARGADMRYKIGNSTQTADNTSHFIANGERLDLYIGNYNTPNIAALTLYGTGTLEITELS